MEKGKKLYLFLFIMISLYNSTLEIELKWKMVVQCLTGITNIIREEIEEELGTICYRGYGYMAECPENSEEKLGPTYIKPRTRACFEKCKDNEIRINHVCYYCDSNKNIKIETNHFGIKKKICQDPITKEETIAKSYKPKNVNENHCMANTISRGFGCEEDCGILGLKPFNDFCASSEDAYKYHIKKFKTELAFLPVKIVTKLFSLITSPPSTTMNDLKLLYEDIDDFIKLEKFNTHKWALEDTIKTRLRILGRQYFSKKVNDYIDNLKEDYAEYAMTICPLYADSTYEKLVSDKISEITFGEGFSYYVKKGLGTFLELFHIDKLIDIKDSCFDNTTKIHVIECGKSYLSLIEDFDPTPISAIYSTLLTYYAEPCDISVKQEYSKELLSYDYFEL